MGIRRKALMLGLILTFSFALAACDQIVIEKDAFQLAKHLDQQSLETENEGQDLDGTDQHLSYYLVDERDKLATLEKILRSMGENPRDYSLFDQDQTRSPRNPGHMENERGQSSWDQEQGQERGVSETSPTSGQRQRATQNSNPARQEEDNRSPINNQEDNQEDLSSRDDWDLPQVSDE